MTESERQQWRNRCARTHDHPAHDWVAHISPRILKPGQPRTEIVRCPGRPFKGAK